MIKKLAVTFTITLVLLVIFYGYNYRQNNREVVWPTEDSLTSTHAKAVQWLVNNQKQIESNHNPALWWMIKESSDIAESKTLKEIYNHYKTGFLDKRPLDIWTPYFRKNYKPFVPDIYFLNNLRDYQLFFVYGLSCDADMGREPEIQKQLNSDFCSMHFLHPRCVTHQMIGIRLMQERSCGDSEMLSSLIHELQNILVTEQIWDFRVGDSYLQRTLVLTQSGAIDSVKAIWLQRILDAQLENGGWGDLHPVVIFSDNLVFGFTSTLPTIRKPESNFHSTAQGIWLLSLLLNN